MRKLGSNCSGVVLKGSKSKPEHAEFRVEFPGGQVCINRCSDGEYWVLLSLTDAETGESCGSVSDARVDIRKAGSTEGSVGDLSHPDLISFGCRVRRAE